MLQQETCPMTRLRFLAALVFPLVPFGPVARAQAPMGTPRVRVETLQGGTGGSLTRVLAEDLAASEMLALTEDAAATDVTVVSGTVTGSRLEGVVRNAQGEEVLRTMYDGVDLRRAAHEFADDVVFALTGRPGIASSRLAFVSDQSGDQEIYVCDADGRNVLRATFEGEGACQPSINRTGSYLIYTSYASGYANVLGLDLLSGLRRRVLSQPGINSGASLSPDGNRLALCTSADGWPVLVVRGLQGGGERHVTGRDGIASAPSWSPTGDDVVFSWDNGSGMGPILCEGRPGRQAVPLAVGFSHCHSPDWSPDGQRLVFVTLQHGRSQLALWERGQTRSRLLGEGRDPCWGANGKHIVFTTGAALIRLNVDTGRRVTIIENFGRVAEPSWTK